MLVFLMVEKKLLKSAIALKLHCGYICLFSKEDATHIDTVMMTSMLNLPYSRMPVSIIKPTYIKDKAY